MRAGSRPPRVFAHPLKLGERGALSKALVKARLPVDDVEAPGPLFWRFETADSMPVGFGGLEIHGEDALLRSLLILPPLRSRGLGGNIMASLRTIVGGEIHEYTRLLEEARRHALDRLVENATAMGANAILMMRYDSAEIGQTMSEIVAYGTAAVIEPVS